MFVFLKINSNKCVDNGTKAKTVEPEPFLHDTSALHDDRFVEYSPKVWKPEDDNQWRRSGSARRKIHSELLRSRSRNKVNATC